MFSSLSVIQQLDEIKSKYDNPDQQKQAKRAIFWLEQKFQKGNFFTSSQLPHCSYENNTHILKVIIG